MNNIMNEEEKERLALLNELESLVQESLFLFCEKIRFYEKGEIIDFSTYEGDPPVFLPTDENVGINKSFGGIRPLKEQLQKRYEIGFDSLSTAITEYAESVDDVLYRWEGDENPENGEYAKVTYWGGRVILEIDFLKTELGAKEIVINGYNPFTEFEFRD